MTSSSRPPNPPRASSRQPRPLERNAGRVLLAILVTLLGLQFASAGPIAVGSGPSGGTFSQFVYQTDYASWLVADLTDPITPTPLTVSPSLTAGRWIQELDFGGGFPNLHTGDTFFLQELLSIGSGDFTLRNWFQKILTPGWQWSAAAVFDSNTSNPVDGLQLNLSPALASFTFHPILTGTDLRVVKVLEYIGPDDVAPAPITLQAYTAVPEPGTAALLASGLIALLVIPRFRGKSVSR